MNFEEAEFNLSKNKHVAYHLPHIVPMCDEEIA